MVITLHEGKHFMGPTCPRP